MDDGDAYDAEDFEFEIRAVSLSGPAPIDMVWVPWNQGLTALYGLNGAGKTRLLRSFTRTLKGYSGDGIVWVEPVPARDDGTRWYSIQLVHLIEEEMAHERHYREDLYLDPNSADVELPWRRDGRTLLQTTMGDALYGRSERMLSAEPQEGGWTPENQCDDEEAYIDEVLRQSQFCLVPVGEPASGLAIWGFGLGIKRDSAFPLVSKDIDRVVAGWRDFRATLAQSGVCVESDEAQAIWQSRFWGFFFQDSLLTASSPLALALRDDDLLAVDVEVARLAESSLFPYALTTNEMMEPLAKFRGVLVDVIDDEMLNNNEWNERAVALLSECTQIGEPRLQYGEDDSRRPQNVPEPSVVIDGRLRRSRVLFGAGQKVIAQPWLTEQVAAISERATAIASALLQGAPPVRLSLREPEHWFEGRPCSWVCQDPTGADVGLSDLSGAQQRWARIAIALALRSVHGDYAAHRRHEWTFHVGASDYCLLALDEPDAGLHATAQRYAVSGLASIGSSLDIAAWVSTHSREFLNSRSVSPMHVYRNDVGHTQVSALQPPSLSQLNVLGIDAADLLQLYRVMLVVEGRHDQLVVGGLIGDELAAEGVLVLPMRGGQNLATVVDAELLVSYSDSAIVAALDNLDNPRVMAFWSDVQSANERDIDAVIKHHFSSKRSAEQQFIINFARGVLTQGTAARFSVFGFSLGDIIEYLPVGVFVPDAESWAMLRSQFEAQTKFNSFKPWLAAKYDASFDDDTIASALAQLDQVPDDFVRLLDACRSAARARDWRSSLR